MNTPRLAPQSLMILRHGQSSGNVARDHAVANGLGVIDLTTRDMDVPLSELGVRQTRAVGRWLGEIPEPKSPTVILASPYQRARQTAIIARESARLSHVPIIYDERLREREFGVLENLTLRGLRHRFPDQAQFRSFLGKFYHRPPGGESWCDVILRLRNAWDSIGQEYANERVLVVCHSVVVLCFRYFLEHLTEEQILEIDRENEVANCSVTFYEFDPAMGMRGDMALRLFNFVAPIEAAGERVTRRKDVVFGGPDDTAGGGAEDFGPGNTLRVSR